MTKKLIILGVIIVLVCLGVGYWYFGEYANLKAGAISQVKAIEIVKNRFPELRDYPSDNLPPKSIKAEKADNGWYLAFVQEGSGVIVIDAQCYWVKDNGKLFQKEYIQRDDIFVGEFSAKDCTLVENNVSSTCAIENCHSLDIKCGPNPPEVCTEIYMIGDKCLKYAKCGIENGKCQQIENSQFTNCKSCVQSCIDANKNDNIKLFDCENKCN
ncbi:MAG: hypothetical protein NTW11_00805 [Candidatus Staskawiczbacteria bacterium]|nr:hypothetical protein [Candidatus Staskawiczbacteria bacterium]